MRRFIRTGLCGAATLYLTTSLCPAPAAAQTAANNFVFVPTKCEDWMQICGGDIANLNTRLVRITVTLWDCQNFLSGCGDIIKDKLLEIGEPLHFNIMKRDFDKPLRFQVRWTAMFADQAPSGARLAAPPPQPPPKPKTGVVQDDYVDGNSPQARAAEQARLAQQNAAAETQRRQQAAAAAQEQARLAQQAAAAAQEQARLAQQAALQRAQQEEQRKAEEARKAEELRQAALAQQQQQIALANQQRRDAAAQAAVIQRQQQEAAQKAAADAEAARQKQIAATANAQLQAIQQRQSAGNQAIDALGSTLNGVLADRIKADRERGAQIQREMDAAASQSAAAAAAGTSAPAVTSWNDTAGQFRFIMRASTLGIARMDATAATLGSSAPDPLRDPEEPMLYPREDDYNRAALWPGVSRLPPALALPTLQPSAVAVGTWTYDGQYSRSIRRTREHGRDILVISRIHSEARGADTLRIDATTLRPIEFRGASFTRYEDNKIKFESYRIRSEFPNAPGVLDLWQLEALLPAFPLAADSAWQVAVFVHGYGFATVPVRVIGRQGLPTPAGTFDSWVVQVTYPYGSPTHPNVVRYYIERNAPHRIVGVHVRESGFSIVLQSDGASPSSAGGQPPVGIIDSLDIRRIAPR